MNFFNVVRANYHYCIYIILYSALFFLFYFSFKTIIHHYSYSQLFINYSAGFVKDGLFGELIFNLKDLFYFEYIFSINLIFLILYIINFFIILTILTPLNSFSKLFFIFFALNPALLLFQINDIGALLRKEVFIITCFLLHVFASYLLNNSLIRYKNYIYLILFLILPFIILNFFIHTIQFLFLPAHYLILKKNLKKLRYQKIIFCLFTILFVYLYFIINNNPISEIDLIKLTKIRLEDFLIKLNFSSSPFFFLDKSLSERFLTVLPYFRNIKFMVNYISAILIVFASLLYFINKITVNYKNYSFSENLLSILPFILLFFIAYDWGRWIHIIFIILISNKLQYKILNVETLNKNILFNIIILLFIFIYLFFFNLPHCCAKNIFFYGLNQNLMLFINILLDNVEILEHIKY